MAHVPVTLRLAQENNVNVLNPTPARPTVHPNDTIAWTCPDGAITVSFDTNDTTVAFDGNSKFHAEKGGQTVKGKIRADVPLGRHFECHVTFNGQQMPVSYGFDTSGSDG
jgi:hypothetical protein